MCMGAPDIPDPIEYQQSQTPVYRQGMSGPRTTGRRGTILGTNRPAASASMAGGAQAGGMGPTPVAPKRTLLGG